MRLANGVRAELTATTGTAVSRYRFPGEGSATLILDVAGSSNRIYGSEIAIESGTVSGWVEAASVCEEGGRYLAYFSATFGEPFQSWEGSLDLSDNSLSRDRLAEAGATPGARLPLGGTGIEFAWSDAGPGEPGNWIPHGQRLRFATRPQALDPARRVTAVVLPESTDRGVMHVFAVALAAA